MFSGLKFFQPEIMRNQNKKLEIVKADVQAAGGFPGREALVLPLMLQQPPVKLRVIISLRPGVMTRMGINREFHFFSPDFSQCFNHPF
jgi:hypothetical protein